MVMDRLLVGLAGALGFLGVALGAFGAHGLRAIFEAAADGARRAEWWETAVRYHLVHALAVAFAAFLATRASGIAPRVAGISFTLGVLVFSGTLYAMALGAPRWLGAVTPIGGVALLIGWGAVIAIAIRG